MTASGMSRAPGDAAGLRTSLPDGGSTGRAGWDARTIQILIADEHAVVRQGLRYIVAGEPDLAIAGEAATGVELLAVLRQQRCDVVVLDVSLPGPDGLALIADLRREFHDVPVLVLSVHAVEQFGLPALRLGAAGYLTKSAEPAELVTAIRRVAAGGRYITPALAEQVATHLGREARLPHETLSDREYLVFRMIADGHKVGQIAAQLALSVKSINTYRARLLGKMGMRRNAELIRYALEHRLPI